MNKRGRQVGFAVAILMMLCSFYYGSKVISFADTMSVKYREEGVTKKQIDNLNQRRNDKEVKEQDASWPYVTGWNQRDGKRVKNVALRNEIPVTLVEVYGDMSTVIPTTLYAGTFVEKADEKGCVISLEVAEKLFGSVMVIGCNVNVENTQYVVRGIMDSEELMLVVCKQEGTYPYLEFRYEKKDYAASNTKAELALLELPVYESFTEGNLYAGVARLFIGVPFLVIWFLLVKWMYAAIKKEQKAVRRYGELLILLIIGGSALLILLKYGIVFSDDYIPSKVSNFAFWSDKLREVRIDYLQMLHYQMWYKESIIVGNLRKCMITGFSSGVLFVILRARLYGESGANFKSNINLN